MNRSIYQMILACGVAASAASADLLPNPGFETVGPLGSLVVTNSGGGGPSAAAGWNTFRPIETPITTELLDSTDPLPGGGGLMLRLTTTSGFGGSSANGVFANLLAAIGPGGVGSIDMMVESGVSFSFGFVALGGGFDSPFNGVGDGTWRHYEVIASTTVGTFGVEIFSGQGGTILMDNARAIPVPGTTAALGLAGLLAARRRR